MEIKDHRTDAATSFILAVTSGVVIGILLVLAILLEPRDIVNFKAWLVG